MCVQGTTEDDMVKVQEQQAADMVPDEVQDSGEGAASKDKRARCQMACWCVPLHMPSFFCAAAPVSQSATKIHKVPQSLTKCHKVPGTDRCPCSCRKQITSVKKDKSDTAIQRSHRNLMLLTLQIVDHANVQTSRQDASESIV